MKTDSDVENSKKDEINSNESPISKPNDPSNWNQSVYSGTEIKAQKNKK